MKTMIALLVLVFSSLAAAQTVTVVVVTPQRPVDCRFEDHKLVNWIYDLKTISEDSKEAVVQFTTQYGQCLGGRTSPYAIDFKWASAFATRNETVWPWQKEGVKTKLTEYTNTEVLVTLTFNKKVLFKKQPENHLSFFFEPGVLGPAQYYRDQFGALRIWQGRYRFPWNVDVYLDGEEESEQVLRVQIR